jgi:hypothetical protein
MQGVNYPAHPSSWDSATLAQSMPVHTALFPAHTWALFDSMDTGPRFNRGSVM